MASKGKRVRHPVDLGATDYALLTEAAHLFGHDRSEVIRRLLRGAMQVGPAMSAENDQRFAAAAMVVRQLGLEIGRMRIVLKSGGVVDFEEMEPVWAAIVEQVAVLTNSMLDIVVGYGIRLREASDLVVPGEAA